MSDFPNVIKFCVAASIRYWRKQFGSGWHLDYNPDWAQKLISSSMSRHLSTHNISSKSMHAFLSILANRQDRQTDKHGQKHLPPPSSEVMKCLILHVYHSSIWLYRVCSVTQSTCFNSKIIWCTQNTHMIHNNNAQYYYNQNVMLFNRQYILMKHHTIFWHWQEIEVHRFDSDTISAYIHYWPVKPQGIVKVWWSVKHVVLTKLFYTSPILTGNMKHITSFLASNVTFAPRLTASIATSLPIPLEPPVTWKQSFTRQVIQPYNRLLCTLTRTQVIT